MIPDELMQFARQLSPMFSPAAAAMAQQERAIAGAAHQVLRFGDVIAGPEANWRELERIARRFQRSRRESARRVDRNRQRAASLVRGADWAPTWRWTCPPGETTINTISDRFDFASGIIPTATEAYVHA